MLEHDPPVPQTEWILAQVPNSGEPFTIDFYECDGLKDCKSFQLSAWYKKEPIFTPAVANEWNAKRRFLKVAVDSDGDMRQFQMAVGSQYRILRDNLPTKDPAVSDAAIALGDMWLKQANANDAEANTPDAPPPPPHTRSGSRPT